jgi:hypothetical protein
MTQGPNPNTASSTAGNAIASLLLGTGTQGNALIQNWKNVASQNFYFGGYVQDDWRVTNRITLNLGLRYDYETPRTERYDRMNFFDPSAPSPLAAQVPQFPDLRGGLVFVGVDGNNRWQFEPDRNNLSPRLGGAFEINEKTVLRGGYSHVYGGSYQQANGTVGPFGFRTENLWVSSLDGITPYRLLRDPYPAGFTESPGSSQGLLTAVGGAIQAPLRDGSPTPWNQQWNVTIQRELPWRVAIEAAYVGTAGHELQTNSESGLSLNQLDPSYQSLGSALNQLVPNPFYGIVTTGVLVAQQVSRAQLLRPYPQFTDIIPLQNTGSTSIYHALQISVNRRMSGGLMLEGSYVWSKAEEEGETHQNSYDVAASRSVASYDIPHRLVMSALYELPFGRGRRFGASAPVLVDAVLGGWQVNGILTIQSGTPLTISASNTAGLFNPVTRAWRGSAATMVRYVRVQSAASLHLRQRRRDVSPASNRYRSEFRLLDVQALRFAHGYATSGADRGLQRAQPRPVRIAQYQRDVKLVRRRNLAGQHAAPAAVRPESVVVSEYGVTERVARDRTALRTPTRVRLPKASCLRRHDGDASPPTSSPGSDASRLYRAIQRCRPGYQAASGFSHLRSGNFAKPPSVE